MRIIGNDPSTPRQAQIVASGTLSTGDAVVVNSDGTVSVVEGSAGGTGSPSTIVAASVSPSTASIVHDALSDNIVVIYRDSNNSNYGTAIVGSISGGSITFGTPSVFVSDYLSEPSAGGDGNGKVVIQYKKSSDIGYARVATISGTSISFGSEAALPNNPKSAHTQVVYDSSNSKFVLFYTNENPTASSFAVVGTVSGTSISFGTANNYKASYANRTGAVYHTASSKVIVAFRDEGNGSTLTAMVGTVSGTSISFGSPSTGEASISSESYVGAAYDPVSEKVVLSYVVGGSWPPDVRGVVCTISGTSVSFGTAVTVSASNYNASVTYNPPSSSFVFLYNPATGDSKTREVSISGTSLSLGAEETITGLGYINGGNYSAAYVPSEKRIAIYFQQNSSPNYLQALTYGIAYTNLTAENYIGTAATGAADTQRAKINLKGAVDENQSGLTAGQSYYVQTDGTLGTTPADPSVFAGTAVAANKLIVKG